MRNAPDGLATSPELALASPFLGAFGPAAPAATAS
jgi:hypothetical protein